MFYLIAMYYMVIYFMEKFVEIHEKYLRKKSASVQVARNAIFMLHFFCLCKSISLDKKLREIELNDPRKLE